ncbi:hypothetical protein L6164_004233 [Bauhinia variegata]|uniref:Uncharacterized protein n=1 Tax=Bauhinia variegata TaxID=167791 RepID=A0ACB9Q985_BAUVA|nr:hypothetical protein L6164_004233 [Bauhinia variegata]
MGVSGRCLKSIISLKKPHTTDQEKVGDKSKKKWRIWRSSSEVFRSSRKALRRGTVQHLRAPPKDFMVIKQEWAAVLTQAVFRAFLEGWCDIPGTADEVKAKLQMRQEAAIKRDRAMAYSFSQQVMSNHDCLLAQNQEPIGQ